MSIAVIRSSFIQVLFVLVSCLLVYFPVISKNALIYFDDPEVVWIMQRVSTMEDYFNLRRESVIVDLQPVRDFSYWVEYKVKEKLDIYNPYIVNVLIWFLVLFGLKILLGLYNFDYLFSLFVVLYISVHPVAVNSVAWISARKHLLAALFLVWASYCWLSFLNNKKKRYSVLTVMFFLLGCLSQPIIIFWPIWLVLTAYNRDKLRIKASTVSLVIFLCSVISLLIGCANYIYYNSSQYTEHLLGGVSKFSDETYSIFAARLLVLGRYFFQLLIPISPSIASYNIGAPGGIIGLGFLVLFGFFIYKSKPHLVSEGLVLMALPLLTVTIKLTHHVGWDTYLLSSLLGWAITVGLIFQLKILSPARWVAFSLMLSLLFILGFKSYRQVTYWTDESKLWQVAAETESTPFVLASYTGYLTNNSTNFPLAWENAMILRKVAPQNPRLPYILGKIIYMSPAWSVKEKEKLFEDYKIESPWYYFYWSVLSASQGHYELADDRMRFIWNLDSNKFLTHFNDFISEATGKWYAMCVKANRTDCRDVVNDVKAKAKKSLWRDNKFQESIQSLNVTY